VEVVNPLPYIKHIPRRVSCFEKGTNVSPRRRQAACIDIAP
jgi:hypothetical protein